MPKSAISAASSTAMTAIGSKAAPRWSSISTAGSRSSAGLRRANSTCSTPSCHSSPRNPSASRSRLRRRRMRIAIVTDAWHPQVNGVVRTLSTVRDGLVAAGHEPVVFGPDRYRTLPCPGYSTIRLAIGAGRALGRQLAEFRPEAVHIATEGPLGLAARSFCLAQGWKFTTAYHTRFPEYVQARCGLPLSWSYAALRRFHAPSQGVMVATETVRRELAARGFERLVAWTRGVDTTLFRPGCEPAVEL